MKASEDQVVEEVPGLQDDEVRRYSCLVCYLAANLQWPFIKRKISKIW